MTGMNVEWVGSTDRGERGGGGENEGAKGGAPKHLTEYNPSS